MTDYLRGNFKISKFELRNSSNKSSTRRKGNLIENIIMLNFFRLARGYRCGGKREKKKIRSGSQSFERKSWLSNLKLLILIN